MNKTMLAILGCVLLSVGNAMSDTSGPPDPRKAQLAAMTSDEERMKAICEGLRRISGTNTLVMTNKEKHDTQLYLMAARRWRYKECIPFLKEIVKLPCHVHSGFDAYAMKIICELGEPKEYFMHLAREWREESRLARLALIVLASYPDDKEVSELMDQILADTKYGYTRESSIIREVAKPWPHHLKFMKEVSEVRDLETKVRLLSREIAKNISVFSSSAVDDGLTSSSCGALLLWIKRELLKYSAAEPRRVAELIVADRDIGIQSSADRRLFLRDAMTQYLSPAAAQEFNRLLASGWGPLFPGVAQLTTAYRDEECRMLCEEFGHKASGTNVVHLEYKEVFDEAVYYLAVVREWRCKECVPMLKEIALSPEHAGYIDEDAMKVLYELGEPRRYFMDLAKDWRIKPRPARHAIVILASYPDDDETCTVLDQIRVEAKEAQSSEGATIARLATRDPVLQELVKKVSEASDLDTKVRLLSREIARQGSPFVPYMVNDDLTSSCATRLLWIKRELQDYSKDRPKRVAELLVADRDIGMPTPAYTRLFLRETMTRYLSPASTEELKRLIAKADSDAAVATNTIQRATSAESK